MLTIVFLELIFSLFKRESSLRDSSADPGQGHFSLPNSVVQSACSLFRELLQKKSRLQQRLWKKRGATACKIAPEFLPSFLPCHHAHPQHALQLPWWWGQVIFGRVTNDLNEPLLVSHDGGQNFIPCNTNNLNTPAGFEMDRQLRIALFHTVIDMFLALPPPSQHCWSTSAPLSQHLLHYLLGDLKPGGLQCQHCNNPNGVCESCRTFPLHVVRLMWMLQSGSGGRGVGTWVFDAQAPVVRHLQYDIYRNATNNHPMSQYARPNWEVRDGSARVGPTCVQDGIRFICDCNIKWDDIGTMPRPRPNTHPRIY